MEVVEGHLQISKHKVDADLWFSLHAVLWLKQEEHPNTFIVNILSCRAHPEQNGMYWREGQHHLSNLGPIVFWW